MKCDSVKVERGCIVEKVAVRFGNRNKGVIRKEEHNRGTDMLVEGS